MRKLLTMDEASEYLGISKLTLYGWVSARKLGFVKVGRLVKFKQEHLDKWIEQHTVKARVQSQKFVTDGDRRIEDRFGSEQLLSERE
ncbi:MAG: helix-turn-helix domain-containing protein [Nitrospira sp.]|nr:helix-turn-helix domain-containing protein [Nitrospira sp.]